MWGVVPGRRGYRRRSETGVEPGAPAAQRDGCRDSSDAGEPAVLTTMSAAMHRYVEVVKQYPGPEQVDMRVEIEVPGSWFGAEGWHPDAVLLVDLRAEGLQVEGLPYQRDP